MKRIAFIIISLITLSGVAIGREADSLSMENIAVESTSPSASALWDNANTAYVNGNYNNAIELYNAIVEQGLSSDKLYFNLANAYYKSGDVARAILNYQRALLISPTDEDILYNLNIVQSQTKDQIEAIPEFFLRSWSRQIGRTFNGTGWTIISLITLALVFGSILMFLLGGVIYIRKIGFGVGLVSALLFIISTSYALEERREVIDHNKAVVMSQSISIKSSPDSSSTDLFMLHNGTTVKILREIGTWCEIVIADGKTGWIEARRLEVI